MIVRQRKQIDHRAARAGLRVERAEIDRLDAGVDDRPGAHRTRLERNIQVAPVQPPAAELFAGLLDGLDLRVMQSVFLCLAAVPAAPDDLSVADNDRADRDLTLLRRPVRELQRRLHVFFLFGHHACRYRICLLRDRLIVPSCILARFSRQLPVP